MTIALPIGFLGAGNMAEALIGGLLAKQLARPGEIFVSDVRRARLEDLQQRLGVCPMESNRDLAARSKTVVFAVKPQNIRDVCGEIGPAALPETLYISICAGVSTRTLESQLTGAAQGPRVVRVMPNTPALIGCGASALAAGAYARQEDVAMARLLFEAVGVAIEVEEPLLDSVTGLTGSGPAYLFYMIEALIEAGCEQGLAPSDAERMVKQMILGSAKLAMESSQSPAQLRQAVTSPGGTTAAGLEILKQGDFAGLVRRCVARATERSRELGRQA